MRQANCPKLRFSEATTLAVQISGRNQHVNPSLMKEAAAAGLLIRDDMLSAIVVGKVVRKFNFHDGDVQDRGLLKSGHRLFRLEHSDKVYMLIQLGV